jgi:hypothetical protein
MPERRVLSDRRRSRLFALAIGAACLLALVLRAWGLGYGLPAIYNQDEVAIMNRALALPGNHLNPKNFLYPTFYFYALMAWEGGFFLVGRVLGLFHSVADFERAFFVDPSRLYLAGRWLSVLCGVATVWATYRLAARLFDRAAALGAAVLLAAAPFAVRDAHYVKHDVPVTLLIVAAVFATARLVVEPDARARRGPWLIAGAWAGLAMSTHYYAIFVTVPIVVAAIGRPDLGERRPVRIGSLALAAAAAMIAFVVASPFMLFNLPTVLRDVVGNTDIVMRASASAGAFASLGAYLSMLWRDAIGWPVIVAGGAGVLMALVSGWRRALVLISFPLPFLCFISNTAPATRYLNPMLPFIAIFAGLALTRPVKSPGRVGAFISVMWVLMAAFPGVMLSVGGDRFFNQTDTRTLAQAFIEREIPAGASILVQPYSVELRQSREGLVEALRARIGSESGASIKFQRQLDLSPYPSPAYRTIYLGGEKGGEDSDKIYVLSTMFTEASDLSALRDRHVQYVVLKRYNEPDQSLRTLIATLEREGTRLAEFSPYRADVSVVARAGVRPFLHNTDARIDAALERPGPIIDIWRIH